MAGRIPTGIIGLDNLIEGGLPKGKAILIVGTPGTGKSILCAQIAYHTALNGKSVLYLNLEQAEGDLEEQMKQFGWNTKKAENLAINCVKAFDSGMVEILLSKISGKKYDLIVIDSLDAISTAPMPQEEIQRMSMEKIVQSVVPTILDTKEIGRLKLNRIFEAIKNSGSTALLTSERVEGSPGISRDTISEFLCDGIILLDSASMGENLTRTIEIKKMRQTDMKGGRHDFSFTKNGLQIAIKS